MQSLIIYFSRPNDSYTNKGNTEVVAEEIARLTNGYLFKCDPIIPYSLDFKKCIIEAKQKKDNNERPELKEYLSDIHEYDVIYIGGPIYFAEYPYEIYSMLDRLDFSGKIVRPFSTHEGSVFGKVIEVLRNKCDGAIIKQGLALRGSLVNEEISKKIIKEWVMNL